MIFSYMPFGFGQVVPWTVVPTSVSQEIVLEKIDSTANYDFKFDTNGDAIGVFFDQGGTWVCGGYIILDGVTKTFLIYGNDAIDNGFQFGEDYHLKYWRKPQNCIIDNPTGGMSNNQYTTGGSDTINVLGAWPTVVAFPKDYYCKLRVGGPVIQLEVEQSTFSNIVVNDIQPPFPNYNAVTGVIEDLHNVNSNTYTFTVSTINGRCLRSPTFQVTISEKLHLTPTITSVQPTCVIESGTIIVDTSMFDNGTKPFTVALADSISGNMTLSASGVFSDLAASSYQLMIKDTYGCADTSTVTLTKPNCKEDISILTPGQNNGYSEIYFPWQGEVTIYNSQGMLVRKMNTPAVWDGTNNNGMVLSTGLYIVFSNDKKMKEITVVY
jgi:hypothetical protein